MTVNELLAAQKAGTYYYHHMASRRGYVSRNSAGIVEPYNGRFGKGFRLITPRWDTTQYVNVSYFVKKEA